MNIKKIIKEELLKEVGGISFEVREWAKIIQDEVKKITEKDKPNYNDDFFGSYTTMGNYYGDIFTHFENAKGDKTNEATLNIEDLFLPTQISNLFTEDEVFIINLDKDGNIDVESQKTDINKLNQRQFDMVLTYIEDVMFDGLPFISKEYGDVYAVSEELTETIKEETEFNNGLITIYGKDFPETYEKFSVDKWVINTNSKRIEYDHRNSGINEEGEYVVYLNMPKLSTQSSAINHEVKHAYDDWNRISKGYKGIKDGWEAKNIYTPDFEKLVLGSGSLPGEISNIIKYYYMGSKLETPAYLETEYDQGGYRDVAKKLLKFKAKNYKDKIDNLDKVWKSLIKKYDIPFFKKFNEFSDFLEYSEKYFNKRGYDIMRRIDKMKYAHGKIK